MQVPPRAEEITIPADVTPEKVPTHIVDYSGRALSFSAWPRGLGRGAPGQVVMASFPFQSQSRRRRSCRRRSPR